MRVCWVGTRGCISGVSGAQPQPWPPPSPLPPGACGRQLTPSGGPPCTPALFRLSFFLLCPRMTRVDLRSYLERIYNVPVAAVRTGVQHGGCPGRGLPLRGAPVAQAAPLAATLARGPLRMRKLRHAQGGGGLPGLELGWPGPAGCSEQGPTLNPPTRSPACPRAGQQSAVFIPLGLSRSFLLTPAPQPPVAQL